MTSLDHLPDDPAELKRLLVHSEAQLNRLTKQNLKLKEQLWQALRLTFGRSSEAAPGQMTMFNEAEVEAGESPPEASSSSSDVDDGESDDVEIKAHRRKPGGRKPLPEHLPRIEMVHELGEEDCVCPHDGSRLKEIGEEISEQLEITPPQAQVIRNIRKKYACPTCDEHVARAPRPPQLIPKSQASAGLLAQVAISKYQDALPLHRQEKQFARLGVDIDRTLLANWMIRVGEALQPLIDQMRTDLLATDVIHSDETTVQVLNEVGRRADQKSYMWVQSTATGPPIVLYHYAPGRSRAVVEALLGDYTGTLVTDGYAAYGVLEKATHAGCWAHARRRFHEALQQQKASKRTGKAQVGFNHIQTLFRLEREFAQLEPDARRGARQKRSKPVIEQLRNWLTQSLPTVAPQSLVGKALGYLDSQWSKLVTFLDDGNVPLTNNACENKIRPFVIGRKNWMFSDSVKGARASAAIYAVIETAKANDVEPYLYLRWLFDQLPRIDKANVDDLRALLPYQCDLERVTDHLARLPGVAKDAVG